MPIRKQKYKKKENFFQSNCKTTTIKHQLRFITEINVKYLHDQIYGTKENLQPIERPLLLSK